MQNPKPVIYDCDNTLGLPGREIDDGLTLIYLLGRPDIHLLAVTTTFGNGTADETHIQTTELLARLHRPDIPVLRGQAEPGEMVNEAACFLAEAAACRPGEISLMASGPLTNLRAAARLDDRFFYNLPEIACMGGYQAPLQIGWRRLPELNLSADPEAAQVVLNGPCPVTLMSAQLCLQAPLGWGDLRAIRSIDPWLHRVVRNWLVAFGLYCGVSRFYLWDLVPAVYLSCPELFAGPVMRVTSTVKDLSTGSLVTVRDEGAQGARLPDKIRDRAHFRRIVYDAWSQALKTNPLSAERPPGKQTNSSA